MHTVLVRVEPPVGHPRPGNGARKVHPDFAAATELLPADYVTVGRSDGARYVVQDAVLELVDEEHDRPASEQGERVRRPVDGIAPEDQLTFLVTVVSLMLLAEVMSAWEGLSDPVVHQPIDQRVEAL